VILALDVDGLPAAEALAERVGDAVGGLKLGLELFTAAGPAGVRAFARRGAGVMLDLKLHDIPETVARATAVAADLGAWMLTIHTAGGRRMMEAAARAKGPRMRLLGVTVLTSLDDHDLAEVGTGPVAETVLRRAELAMASGLDGVVASPLETAALRARLGPEAIIVTPGVRPAGAGAADQKRTATPEQARAAGASYIVVGRPIRDAADPRAAASAISRAFGDHGA
jgi:orotidine-5'-phosphate decarboxylase